jgi:phage-related protein
LSVCLPTTAAQSASICSVCNIAGRSACRSSGRVGKGLFEVRTDLPDGTTARVLFCFHGGELYALHGFIKKARKTPPADLKLARDRQKEVNGG